MADTPARIWLAHITADLDRLTGGILDLIDCGLPNQPHPLRNPTDNEIVGTRRGNDTDADYATPGGTNSRTHTIPDPVGNETLRWADTVAQALADLDIVIGAWHPTAAHITAIGGTTTPPPPAPLPYGHDGTPTIDLARARRATLTRIRWLTTVADNLADAWDWETHPDLIDNWTSRAHTMRYDLHGTALRHGRTDPADTRCLNPGGLHNHPAGPQSINGICRRCRTATWCATCQRNPPADARTECWTCINARNYRRRKARVADR